MKYLTDLNVAKLKYLWFKYIIRESKQQKLIQTFCLGMWVDGWIMAGVDYWQINMVLNVCDHRCTEFWIWVTPLVFKAWSFRMLLWLHTEVGLALVPITTTRHVYVLVPSVCPVLSSPAPHHATDIRRCNPPAGHIASREQLRRRFTLSAMPTCTHECVPAPSDLFRHAMFTVYISCVVNYVTATQLSQSFCYSRHATTGMFSLFYGPNRDRRTLRESTGHNPPI